MATSFRFPSDKMSRLEFLSKKLGKSKAQVVIQAIDELYETERMGSKQSALDLLVAGGFTPLAGGIQGIAEDEQRQRQVIRERLARKNRP